MYLLDTDHVSLIDRGGPEGRQLAARLALVPPEAAAVSIVSFEEQTRGWMAAIARTKTVERQIPYYRELERLLRFYADTPLLAFDDGAAAEFTRLRRQRVRIGTMDLKIAAIALAHGATLLSRNLSDFRQVLGLIVED